MEKWNLPDGWEWIQLGNLCTLTGGGTPDRSNSSYFDGDIVWITPTDIVSSTLIPTVRDSKTKITDEGSKRSSAKLVKEGTVLFSSRATIGKIAIAGIPLATNQGFANFTCSDKLYNRYLAWVLKALTENIKGLASSAVYLEINRTKFREFSIPIPYPDNRTRSLETQQRIVARLEALLAEVASARGLQDEIVRDTEQVMDATRHELFTELAKRVSIKKFDEIADSRLGKMLSTVSKTGKYYRPYLRNANVLWDAFDLSDVSEMDFEPDKRERYALRPGDVLICEGGDIGRSAVWEGQIPECYYQKALHRVRLRDEQALPRYLMHYMAWSSKNGAIAQLKTGAAIPHLTGASLSTLDVVWPDPIEQKKVVIHLDTVSDEIKAMQMENKENSLLLTQLEQSFLAQAFRGEL